MTVYDSDITYNGVSLRVLSVVPIRRQKTRKSTIGKTLTQVNIIGLNSQQWELRIEGIIMGTTAANLSTNRAAIEAFDVITPYTYVDGIHNGTYITSPSSLIIKDVAEDVGVSYNFSMTLVEE